MAFKRLSEWNVKHESTWTEINGIPMANPLLMGINPLDIDRANLGLNGIGMAIVWGEGTPRQKTVLWKPRKRGFYPDFVSDWYCYHDGRVWERVAEWKPLNRDKNFR